MSNAQSLKQGQTVGSGRFTLVMELGRGGMGVLWTSPDMDLMTSAASSALLRTG